ncbi:MAG: CDP-alcohol phosphatidyltransferase family protein [Candidatus Aenigmarchaeota archaeon]|nr:CDP-alcohol phosphatidyltransferase family protein [Candidatus Aenigmarchaeota archaeon]
MLFKNRSLFAGFGIWVGRIFSRIPLSANAWSLLAIVPACFAFYFLFNHLLLYAAGATLIAGFLDIIDGAVARETKTASKQGAYIDTIIDRYVEGIIILGLFFVNIPQIIVPTEIVIALYLFGAFMTTYAKSAAKEKELTTKEISGGLIERAERLLLLVIGLAIGASIPIVFSAILVVLAVLTNVSALQRIRIALSNK